MWKLIIAAPIAWSLAAAPGEPIPYETADVGKAVTAALGRRFGGADRIELRGMTIKPSTRMPGFVACGQVATPGAPTKSSQQFQRFFAVVPGGVALIDADGTALIDSYWQLNGC